MDTTLQRRRTNLIRDIASRYQVATYPGRDRPAEILISRTDFASFRRAVLTDPRGDAVSRGYYLGLGGELLIRAVPDWLLSARDISRARVRARVRRALRLVTR